MAAAGWVATRLVQRGLALATMMGARGDEIAAAAGISLEALADRDGWLPLDALVTVFDEIHMSARSLQRRLRDEGSSFQTLVDAARRDLAKPRWSSGAILTVTFEPGGTST